MTLIALFGLAAMHAIFWTITQPINKFWPPKGRSFHRTETGEVDWLRLRNKWEHSHIARAGLTFLSFFALVLAMVVAD